ncbi:zinc finger, CCHC-type containing protein [Tanacetum coccineum]
MALRFEKETVFSIWKAFGGNTRDLGSLGEETDKTTDLHQHLSRISTQKLETASQITRDAVTTHTKTASQDLQTASEYLNALPKTTDHHGIDRCLQIQIFYDHVSFHLKCDIDRAADGKLRNKNADESWEIIEKLTLYDHEGWDDTKEFIKPVKAISIPQGISKTHDQRLLELENQINFLQKGSRPTLRSSTHIPHAYADAVYSNPRPQSYNEPPKLNPFTFYERTGPSPQPQALGTTFEARVRDYMAAHTKRIERFENAIFKQCEDINDRMTEIFRLLKELTTRRTPEKVLIREEAKFPVTKNVNSISLARGEEERSDKMDETLDNTVKPTITETEIPVKEAERNNETKNKPIKKAEKKEVFSGGSTQFSAGIVEDVLVEVVEHVYPIDFVILDIKEDEKRPFILGVPFLTTVKAVIKFDKGTITLRSGKSKISFHKIPEPLCKTERGVKNDIEPIAPTTTVNRLVLE